MDHLTNLLIDARNGDRRALERFIAETQADVWRLCRYLGDQRVADDLAQETYERAIGSLHRFRADGSARAWLLTIARRVCADHTRRAIRRRRLDRATFNDATAGGISGDTVAPDRSGRVELDELLGGLDPDRRAAFVLTQVLGMHYDEAASVLGCPVGTIRSRVLPGAWRPDRDARRRRRRGVGNRTASPGDGFDVSMRDRRRPIVAAAVSAVLLALASSCGADGADVALSEAGARGRAVANANGCAACHGADGQGGVGPTWVGLAGAEVELLGGGVIVADDAYLVRSIVDPAADLRAGYLLQMPANNLTESEVADVIAYIKDLSADTGDG